MFQIGISIDEAVQNELEYPTPTLLIQGDSLLDPTARSVVVVEKTIVCNPQNTLEGLLITFLMFYIFGLEYPKELIKTLEFIQRY